MKLWLFLVILLAGCSVDKPAQPANNHEPLPVMASKPDICPSGGTFKDSVEVLIYQRDNYLIDCYLVTIDGTAPSLVSTTTYMVYTNPEEIPQRIVVCLHPTKHIVLKARSKYWTYLSEVCTSDSFHVY